MSACTHPSGCTCASDWIQATRTAAEAQPDATRTWGSPAGDDKRAAGTGNTDPRRGRGVRG